MVSCSSANIPNIRLYAEIPFVDGAEAVFAETVSGQSGMLKNREWERIRPYMLMIHIEDWSKIKKSWLRACRLLRSKCNVKVVSIDKIVTDLDRLVGRMVK